MISGGSTDFINFYQIYDVIFDGIFQFFSCCFFSSIGFTVVSPRSVGRCREDPAEFQGGHPRLGRLLFMAGHSGEVGPPGGTVSS